MARLTVAEVEVRLMALPGWKLDAGALMRTWEFESFSEAIEFVNEVAALAEEVDHHPDFEILYRRVRLRLRSHDVGGVTNRDFMMAMRLNSGFVICR